MVYSNVTETITIKYKQHEQSIHMDRRQGKRVWVKRELPGTKLILRYASQKQEYASPTSILIDDRQKNIDQWEAAGGIGILHTSTANTIEQLKKLGL